MSKFRQQSTGQMISTLSYVVVAIWLANEARSFDGPLWKLVALWIASGLALAGALRFQISDLVDRLRD